MAVAASNVQINRCGVAFQFTGDGTTTAITVPLHVFFKPNLTAKAVVLTGASNLGSHSGKGGLIAPAAGTNVPVASCVVSKTGITVTTTAAVANGTVANVVVIFDQATE